MSDAPHSELMTYSPILSASPSRNSWSPPPPLPPSARAQQRTRRRQCPDLRRAGRTAEGRTYAPGTLEARVRSLAPHHEGLSSPAGHRPARLSARALGRPLKSAQPMGASRRPGPQLRGAWYSAQPSLPARRCSSCTVLPQRAHLNPPCRSRGSDAGDSGGWCDCSHPAR